MNEVIVIAALAILLAGLVYIATRRQGKLDKAYFARGWGQVEKLAAVPESGASAAIVEADKLLDQALKQAGYPGAKMVERLQSAEHRFRDKEAVWAAHKLRNRLLHEQHVKLGSREAGQTLASFQRALKDLRAL